MKDIERVIQRSRRYRYVDGVADLYLGSLFFLSGLYRLIIDGLLALVHPLSMKAYMKETANPLLSLLVAWLPICSSVILLFVFFYLMKMITRRAIALKECFTYPRIGYVEPRIPPLHQRLMIGSLWGAGVGLVPILVSTFAPQVSKSIYLDLVLVSLLWTFICLYAGVILAQTRYYILTAVSTLLVIVLSQAIISESMALTLYVILMGVALIISGGFTFRNFLRQNPLPKDELQ